MCLFRVISLWYKTLNKRILSFLGLSSFTDILSASAYIYFPLVSVSYMHFFLWCNDKFQLLLLKKKPFHNVFHKMAYDYCFKLFFLNSITNVFIFKNSISLCIHQKAIKDKSIILIFSSICISSLKLSSWHTGAYYAIALNQN